MAGPTPEQRASYRYFVSIATRWMDNDIYGHVNNVVYYSYFDTVINRFLIERGALDVAHGPCIGLCVESSCQYLRAITFPDAVEAGLRVATIGRSSVRYDVGIFRAGEETASAQGHFVHVFVDREARRASPIPDAIRAALADIMV
jgi:acyl-CoA thioester hydrolase